MVLDSGHCGSAFLQPSNGTIVLEGAVEFSDGLGSYIIDFEVILKQERVGIHLVANPLEQYIGMVPLLEKVLLCGYTVAH